jgi:transposase
VIKKGSVVRRLRTLPIGKRTVWLAVHVSRLFCRDCSALRQAALGLSLAKKHWTKQLGRYIVEMLRCMTVEDIARHLGMSWVTVRDIHVWALNKRFPRKHFRQLRCLGIDEIAVKKGHRYLTIVVDLESGEVVHVAEGRSIASVEPFFKRLRRSGARIEAIAMDMWPAFISAAKKWFPGSAIVFDRYHVIAEYNRMLDVLRRAEAAAAQKEEKHVYKGVRYLLLKGQEKIEDGSSARKRLDHLLEVNATLHAAYVLKEELRSLWGCSDRPTAEAYLSEWLAKAWSSGVALVKAFANKIATHWKGILNYFDYPITTGPVEGINNKIKVLKRMAYGFRNLEYFKLRIYALHETRYALLG